MAHILIASDASRVVDDVTAVFTDDLTFDWVKQGALVLPTVQQHQPDLAIFDFQIGNMGGMATTLDLRLEEGIGRLPHIPVLLLLDRRPDVFLARRSDADGWLIKPLDPIRLRTAITALLAGGNYHDDSLRPEPTAVVYPTSQPSA